MSRKILRWYVQACYHWQQTQVPDDGRRAALGRACGLPLDSVERSSIEGIERVRRALQENEAVIEMGDFGAGPRALMVQRPGAIPHKPRSRTVASIYRRAAVPESWGVFLFCLIRALQPVRVLELGTSLGISAAYLRRALDLNTPPGRLTTLEGDPVLAQQARALLARLSPNPVQVVTGAFQDTLPRIVEQEGPFDWVFIDGHHEEEATIRYFELMRPFLSPRACVVFDDLEPWTTSVRRAWNRVRAACPSASAVDFVKWGLLFMNPR